MSQSIEFQNILEPTFLPYYQESLTNTSTPATTVQCVDPNCESFRGAWSRIHLWITEEKGICYGCYEAWAKSFWSTVCNGSSKDIANWVRNFLFWGPGCFESILVEAFAGVKFNTIRAPLGRLRHLFFREANRAELLQLGPLPGPGPFQIYRGVSGVGKSRRERGISWTSDIRTAAFFALNDFLGDQDATADPQILTIEAEADWIYCCPTVREGEAEFVVKLPPQVKPAVVSLTRKELEGLQDEGLKQRHAG